MSGEGSLRGPISTKKNMAWIIITKPFLVPNVLNLESKNVLLIGHFLLISVQIRLDLAQLYNTQFSIFF